MVAAGVLYWVFTTILRHKNRRHAFALAQNVAVHN